MTKNNTYISITKHLFFWANIKVVVADSLPFPKKKSPISLLFDFVTQNAFRWPKSGSRCLSMNQMQWCCLFSIWNFFTNKIVDVYKLKVTYHKDEECQEQMFGLRLWYVQRGLRGRNTDFKAMIRSRFCQMESSWYVRCHIEGIVQFKAWK